MSQVSGSCLCGKVRYTTSADPVFTGVCHCNLCKKATGSAFSTVAAFPADALTVTGTTKQFDIAGDSGNATHRQFCPECGSMITHSADMMQGLTMISVGTLDDPSWVKPAMQIYCDSALPWAKYPDLKEFPGMPS